MSPGGQEWTTSREVCGDVNLVHMRMETWTETSPKTERNNNGLPAAEGHATLFKSGFFFFLC